ncbi:MAG TPA: A/G-specific adenine glycosylase [Gemmatimonadales bacterium]|jgi:A/G-specific adenine glycosylase
MSPKSRAERARQAVSFRRGLLRWYRRHGRDLPWRHTRDPYHIVVSEFMLQQTQVSRVEAYYHRFLERYPTVHTLAAAPPAAVRESWEGLGYYRRAANLHRLAQAVVDEHGGVMPSDPVVLAKLPGVGRYTAGAVACFAYEKVAATVDTNVARVLRRVFHPRLAGRALSKRIWRTALEILPSQGKRAWHVNQALMELGALICTARVAKCGECPVRGACRTGRRRASGYATIAPPISATRANTPATDPTTR